MPVWKASPYGIVSLMDILKEYGHTFLRLGQVLTAAVTVSQMGARSGVKHQSARDFEAKCISATKQMIDTQLPEIIKCCRELHLQFSAIFAERIINDYKNAGQSDLHLMLSQLQSRIDDELSLTFFRHVTKEQAELFSQTKPFGEKVADKFPKAIEDIDEATKCMALERYTAAVFHLMRVMEIGVQHLGKKLKVPNPAEREWHKILTAVNGAIKQLSNPPTPITAKQKSQRDKLAQAAVYLENVKNAWRNSVMHPKATYTEVEARRVYDTVKTYMEYLAEIL